MKAVRHPAFGFLLWLAAVLSATVLLARYSATPGADAGPAPATLPAALSLPPHAPGPVFCLVLHPRCPCSFATLSELERALAVAPARATVVALFVLPGGPSADAGTTPLMARAGEIPGVVVRTDGEGAVARLLGATTSGTCVAWDTEGLLRFSGGLTEARAHEGAGAGSAALRAMLRGEVPQVAATPVYGCPLFAGERRP